MYTLPNVPLPMIEPKSTLHLLTRTQRAGAWCDGGVVSSLCRIDVTGMRGDSGALDPGDVDAAEPYCGLGGTCTSPPNRHILVERAVFS